MLPPVLTKWKINKVTENILLFAQLVEELLFNYSPDEYKLQALNSRIICAEAQHILDGIAAGRQAEEDIRPVVEELASSLLQDPAAAELLPVPVSESIAGLRAAALLPELKTRLDILDGILNDGYFEKICQLLKEFIIFNDTEKISQLTRNFLAELIDRGFSSEFIFFEAKNHFFEGRTPAVIESIEALEDFYQRFPAREKNWIVIFRVGKDLKRIRNFSSEVKISLTAEKPRVELPEKAETVDLFLVKNYKLPNYLIVKNVKAFDPFSARHLAEEHLWAIESFVRFHVHRKSFEWSSAAFIQDAEKTTAGVYGQPVPPVLKRPDQGPGALYNFITDMAATIFGEILDSDSTQRLFRAFQRHDMAARSPLQESQLLTLWSAIQILFPSDSRHPEKPAHLIDILGAYVIRGYAAKQAADLVKSIRIANSPEAVRILESITDGHNPIEKCLLLLTTKENQEKRKKLLFVFVNHVLLKQRILSLSRSFSTTDAILQTIAAHREKVAWQIERIFRARNLIFRSGENPPGVGILVENLHSYFDRVMEVLVEEISRKKGPSTIDEIHLDVAQKAQAHHETLKKSPGIQCTGDNFKLFLFGS